MSILVKDDILTFIKKGKIVFTPELDIFQLQGHAIDLRLGYTFLIPKSWQLTKEGRKAISLGYGKANGNFDTVQLKEGQYFEILPREFVVVSTLEKVKLSKDIMAVLYPRSSTNRKGLSVDLSGVIDAGYEGGLIIPVRNNTDNQVIRLHPGERLCQLVFHKLSKIADIRESRYANKKITVGVLEELHSTEEELVVKGDIKNLKKKYKVTF